MSTNIRSQIVQYKKYLIHISLIPPPEGWRSRSIISELSDRLGLACLDDSDRFATEDEAVLHSVRLGMRWIDKQENKSTTSTSKELYATAPGTFIALESSVGWHLRSSIEIMANYFSDAHLAQILFEEAAARQRSAHAEFGQVYRRARREAFMYAREFVFACDYFVKEFKKMTEQKDAPSGIAEELENSKTRIPEIVNLRNSLHHPEDRRRGEKRGGKKITIQPINKYPFKSEVGFMIISSIIGSRIMGTAADGRLVEVDVSVATLHEMAQTLQHVIDALPWYTFHGPHRYPDADF